jgi:uncharacterized membrane protein
VLSPDRRRSWGITLGFGVALGIVLLAYPYVLKGALVNLGVRGVALGLLALAALSILLPTPGGRRGFAAALPALGIPSLLLLSALTGDRLYLMLVPAAIFLVLAAVFRASLRAPDSIIERAARFLIPEAPTFIRSYCRTLTNLWAGLFVSTAAVIAWLAVTAPLAHWEAFTGWIVYVLMVAFTCVEFLVRKTWFRYYFYGGPFDRFWSRIFPAENTARGRQSQEYIRAQRARLAQRAARD